MKSFFVAAAFWTALVAAGTAELACTARAFALVLQFGSPLSVYLGTLAGTALTLLVIFAGDWLHGWLPAPALRLGAGLFFLAMGLWILLGRHAH